MNNWLRRLRGAVGTGLTWAVIWVLAGLLIGVASKLVPGPLDFFFEVFDAPLPAIAMPGFIGGVLFSIVLGIAARRRRFSELSLTRFAAWGALGGLLMTLLPFAMVAVGLASTHGAKEINPLKITAVMSILVVLSAASATASLLIARRAERRASLEADPDLAEVGR